MLEKEMREMIKKALRHRAKGRGRKLTPAMQDMLQVFEYGVTIGRLQVARETQNDLNFIFGLQQTQQMEET